VNILLKEKRGRGEVFLSSSQRERGREIFFWEEGEKGFFPASDWRGGAFPFLN